MLLSLFSVASRESSKRTPGHLDGELAGFAVLFGSVVLPSLPSLPKKININIFVIGLSILLIVGEEDNFKRLLMTAGYSHPCVLQSAQYKTSR